MISSLKWEDFTGQLHPSCTVTTRFVQSTTSTEKKTSRWLNPATVQLYSLLVIAKRFSPMMQANKQTWTTADEMVTALCKNCSILPCSLVLHHAVSCNIHITHHSKFASTVSFIHFVLSACKGASLQQFHPFLSLVNKIFHHGSINRFSFTN